MTIKIKYWLDSGANIHSQYEGKTTTDEIGITDDEWRSMTDQDKEEMMREYAFERSDWGYISEDEE